MLTLLETYSELCQKSKMELFVKIVNGWKPSPVFEKNTILDVSQGFENASTFSVSLFIRMFFIKIFDHYNKSKDKMVPSNFNLDHYFLRNILQKIPGSELTKFNLIQRFIRNPAKHIRWSTLQKYLTTFSR